MILKIFKSQTPIIFFLLVIFTLLLWSDIFLFKNAGFFLTNNDNVLFELSFSWLAKGKYLSLSLSLLCILFQAIWLNSIVVNTDITGKGTMLPGLLYITLICSNQETLTFNGAVISAFFIIYILQTTFSIYGKMDCFMDIFKISLAVSIGSLFYLPMIFYILFIWAILFVYRTVNLRIIVISLVGFLLPYVYVLFFYFWFDKTPEFLQHLITKYNSLFIHNSDFRIYLRLIPIIMGCLYLFSIVGLYRKMNSRVIKIRKYIFILNWMFVISLIIALFFTDSTFVSTSLLCIPATFFVTDYFLSFKRNWIAELLFAIVIILIVVEKLLQIP